MKSASTIKSAIKSTTNNNNNTQELDLIYACLSFSNQVYIAKTFQSMQFQFNRVFTCQNKQKSEPKQESSKKSKYQKVGTLKINQKQKHSKISNDEMQQMESSRNKQISIQYYHSDLKEIMIQRSKFSPQKQTSQNEQSSNMASINSLYHVFKNVQLKVSQPQNQSQNKLGQTLNASAFLKSIATKSKVMTNTKQHQSPINYLKDDQNNGYNQEQHFLNLSKIELTSKKIQKSNKNSALKQPNTQGKNSQSNQKIPTKNKFQKVQQIQKQKPKQKILNEAQNQSNSNNKQSKKKNNTPQHLTPKVKQTHKRTQTDDSLQNLHIQLQYIHKVSEDKQKQKKQMQKQKQKQKQILKNNKKYESFDRVLEQEEMMSEQEYKILRSTQQLSQMQIYQLMNVEGNKYKEIALKNYFKKQKKY